MMKGDKGRVIGGILGKLVGFRDKRESDWDFDRILCDKFEFFCLLF